MFIGTFNEQNFIGEKILKYVTPSWGNPTTTYYFRGYGNYMCTINTLATMNGFHQNFQELV